jgi:uncharacterized RDD family membrane protein YckC
MDLAIVLVASTAALWVVEVEKSIRRRRDGLSTGPMDGRKALVQQPLGLGSPTLGTRSESRRRRTITERSASVETVSADVFDALLVALTWIGIYLFVGFVPFVAHPLRGFHLPAPAPWFSGLTFCALAIAYLTLSWSGTGRSIGKRIAGVRLEGQADSPIGGARSFARAILYVVLPIGLLWVIVSPRNRSVWDLILSTEVVYDWNLPPARVTETARGK